MFPGTLMKWHDHSQRANRIPVDLGKNAPLFMTSSAFDRGTEDLIEIYGEDFGAMYGTMSFDKYGQVSIQAQNLIDNGGKLFVKRLVAPDSSLANVIITVTVDAVQKMVQRRDDNGLLLYYTDDTESEMTTKVTAYPVKDPVYLDENGNETTEITDTPVNVASLKWEAQSVEEVTGTSFADAYNTVKTAAKNLSDENVFALIPIVDNGRGASNKSIRFMPDYMTSRGAGRSFYTYTIYDNNKKIEEKSITLDPDKIYNEKNYGLNDKKCIQAKGFVDEAEYARLITAISDITMEDPEVVKAYDLFNGANLRGQVVDSIVIDSDSVDLNSPQGITLANGDNGSFTDAPMLDEDGREALFDAMVEFYDGTFSPMIYDVDQHQVALILDAAFPNRVKDAIGKLVAFRKDCMFFRDIGVGHTTFADIFEQVNNLPEIPWDEYENATITNDRKTTDNTKFFSNYVTSYEIEDPNTHKYIEVTMLYDMAAILPMHLMKAPNSPFAGTSNGFVLESAIEGTINFVPLNTPNANQRTAMEDLRANYAIFQDDQCVVQSLYTCQPPKSQLDWINNVIAIEHIMRVVRNRCPKSRYTLSEGRGLDNYAKDVSNVLEEYESLFDILRFVFTQNELQADQKIFAASIEFAFQNWAQTEYFDLYAINADEE